MPRYCSMFALAVVLVGGAILSGCGLDPMEQLTEEMNSPELPVLQAAVTQLANLHDQRATDALILALDGNAKIGDLAGVALVKKGRERTTKQKPDPLLDAIAKVMGNLHTSQENRARAAWALGEIGDRMAIPALKGAGAAKTAAGTDALLVRQAATEALEKLGYDTPGRAFEIALGGLNGDPETGYLSVLPVPKKIVLPPPAKPA
jgi:HEAT repeat protein